MARCLGIAAAGLFVAWCFLFLPAWCGWLCVALVWSICLWFIFGWVRKRLERERAPRRTSLDQSTEHSAKTGPQSLDSENRPLPNLVFSKFDVITVGRDANGRLVRAEHDWFTRTVLFESGRATVFAVLNKITEPGHRILQAVNVNVRLEYYSKDSTDTEYVVESGQWLGSGKTATINPGISERAILCSYRNSAPCVVDSLNGHPDSRVITQGKYDVIVTLSCANPQIYVKRFHFLFDTAAPHEPQNCDVSPEHCSLCRAHRIA